MYLRWVSCKQRRRDQTGDVVWARLRVRCEQGGKCDRPDKQAAHELGVRPLTEFPSRTGPSQDQRDVASLGGKQPLLERPGELRIAGQLGDEARETRARLVGSGQLGDSLGERGYVALQRPAVDGIRKLAGMHDGGKDHLGLGAPPAVHGAAPHAGLRCHALNRRAGVTVAGKQLTDRGADRRVDARLSRTTGCAALGHYDTDSTVNRPGPGRVSSRTHTPEQSAFARDDITVTVVMGTTGVPAGTFPAIAARALDGTLPDPISRRYRLDEAGQAYRDLAATEHMRGKFVVSTEPVGNSPGSS